MQLTDTDKERCRYHLGYLEVQPAASIQLGIPRPIQTVFLVEQALNNLADLAIPRVVRVLNVLDGLEGKLVDAQDFLVAEQLEDLKLRDKHPDLLDGEYVRWAKRLADILGVPLYPYSNRFKGLLAGAAGSIPVRQ